MIDTQIEFDVSQYSKIREDGYRFWDGTLNRPLIQIYLSGKKSNKRMPLRAKSELLLFFDDKVSCSDFVDVWQCKLSDKIFMGDAFPYVRPLLGSSAMAVFMDCNYVVDANTIWFEPLRHQNLKDIEIRYNPDNMWLKRTRDIYSTAIDRWQGSVQPVITNLGGVFDILAMIISSEEIVYAMYDQPEQVERLIWQIHQVWWQYYEDLLELIQPYTMGYMDFWLPIPCRGPSFILQCDFCSLLTETLFDKFVKPELEASCRQLGGAMYHLDGPGAIRHLDSLLSIDNLKVIQWVPGDGQKDISEWPEVYSKVRKAGKQLFLTAEGFTGKEAREKFDRIVGHCGSPEGLCYLAYGDVIEQDAFGKWLADYGVV